MQNPEIEELLEIPKLQGGRWLKPQEVWLSSMGIELRLSDCCQTWLGDDHKGRKIEFDGMPHSCPKGTAKHPIVRELL